MQDPVVANYWEREEKGLPAWNNFKDILLKTFIQDLIDEHRKLHIVLPHRLLMPEELDIYNFSIALNPEIQDHVLWKEPKTLIDAYQYACNFEQTIISDRHLQRQFARKRSNMQCYGYEQIGHLIRKCHHSEGFLVEVTKSSWGKRKHSGTKMITIQV
ncbi:hypothetical protein E3Q19_03789 [Wallemia mellicola]|nr:hypothetical protein E3Q19_03789 [Wallemia mellicola]TIC21977.1 hypothetical protein E3Q11_04282 [Wallemia mellicola]TIC72697.1 hypothetical protein E3Q00_03707 [Wallemia mellicola]